MELMEHALNLSLDRAAKTTLAEQIRLGIIAAIDSGVLAPGARLPSWQDLAAQLGVARGTVKMAYERLADEQLVVSSGPGGTRVADHPAKATSVASLLRTDSKPALYEDFFFGPAIFKMGIPASDCFPVSLLARLRAHAVRAEVGSAAVYPDPRGEHELRREITAHLALTRGLKCEPSQVFITAGFSGALGLTLRVLGAEGRKAWTENPGFPLSRKALKLSRLTPVPIPVDEEGMDVSYAIKAAPDAAVALITPGQQAPFGVTLSLARRIQLIEWATHSGAWLIEDDYLGELQLKRRAAPSLASLDGAGRVIHIGTFSKTISPALRLGFIVAPAALVPQFVESVMCLAPAPGPAVQLATAEFMRDGHYMRHLRRMKRVYTARCDLLQAALKSRGLLGQPAGLGMLLRLPNGARDDVIAREARAYGLAPSPLSIWFCSDQISQSGLLLGVATVTETQVSAACDRLHELIDRFS